MWTLTLGVTEGQRIVIGDRISVTVIAVRGDRVWLGIDAPRDVAVHRDDVVRERPENGIYGQH